MELIDEIRCARKALAASLHAFLGHLRDVRGARRVGSRWERRQALRSTRLRVAARRAPIVGRRWRGSLWPRGPVASAARRRAHGRGGRGPQWRCPRRGTRG
eukprot:scaffold75850_cov27-Tisochrysis_lutea.AAC.2